MFLGKYVFPCVVFTLDSVLVELTPTDSIS